MAGEEIKLNAKADNSDFQLTEPTLSRPNPLRGNHQAFDTGQLEYNPKTYYAGNPQLKAEAELAKGLQLKQPSFTSDHQPLFASDQKSGGTKITLGGAKKDEDEKKAEKSGDGTKTAAGEKTEEPDFFAKLTNNPLVQELLGGLNSDEAIPGEIMRLDPPQIPQGSFFADAGKNHPKSTTGGDFFKQFNRKPPSRIG